GTIVGARDRFAQRDPPAALPPQPPPRPRRLTPPTDHAGYHPDHQSHCGAGISANRPADEAASENADDDRQPGQGRHRSRRAPATRTPQITAPTPDPRT